MNVTWLLLPRPWLGTDSSNADTRTNHRNACRSIGEQLYVRGTVCVGGRTVNLAYWHRVARIDQPHVASGVVPM